MNQVLNLLLPTPCVGCRAIGSPFCPTCRNKLELNPKRVIRREVDGYAFCAYEGIARDVINAIKELGQTSLIGPLATSMASNWPPSLKAPILVPIPSSQSNFKKRGFQHTNLLASALAKRIPGAVSRSLLRSVTRREDQARLDPTERLSNLAGAFELEIRGFQAGSAQLVLIDDVLTTGATVSAAAEAFAVAGLGRPSFCVIAETTMKAH